jgi:hypothetical protein
LYAQSIQPDHTAALAAIIAFDSDGRAIWPAQQLRAALHRQLVSTLSERQQLEDAGQSAHPPIETLGQLLHHPRPPMKLLWLAKEHAKLSREDPHSPLPPEVALLLYYGSIAAALLRHGQRISRLSDDDLRGGFNWSARQEWVDEPTRLLFLEAMAMLRSGWVRWRE